MREYFGHRTYRAKRPQEQKRKVRKGELILISEPFVSVINNENRLKYCDYCITSAKDKVLHPCRSCRVPWYCSDDCKRLASDLHAHECPHLKRITPTVPPDFVRLVARVIFRLKDGGEKVVEKYSEKEGRRFKDLMSHYADIKDNDDCRDDVDFVMKKLKEYIGEDNMPNYSDFLGIYGRVVVNRFCLLSNSMVGVGSALYLAASIIDHACIPNCSFYFSGRRVHIRSLVDVEDFQFDKCRISYVDPVSSVTSRREELHKKWFFWCDCSLCGDRERIARETSMKCENCDSPVYVPEKEDPRYPTTPTCTRCGLAIDPVVERRYKDLLTFTKRKLHAMTSDGPDIEMCVELLKRQDELFHPNHVWRVKTMDYAFNAAVFGGCCSLVYDFGVKNLEGMRYYYGSEHPIFGVFLLKLGKAKIYLKLFREGLQLLEEAEPILRRAYGSTHYLLTEELGQLSLLANEDLEIRLERRLQAWKKREEVEETKKLEKKLQDFLDIGSRSGTQRFRGSLS
ncbi:histone-lysine N-methyltransferase SMYD3-like [Penaeus japonicus]|uniref:histone-lysine N-methyltransferase SMYD3-like n=1 Tax=Penaeus japonicus TaxID=27405 RepID=UPI001C713E90|nr:histone-lysine N-methyltransferase SMYD3-like [Penaeus japonicus]